MLLTVDIIAKNAYRAKPKHVEYIVILDRSKGFPASSSNFEDYTVIYEGNNHENAVNITNFWDERMNVHLVEVGVSVLNRWAEHDLKISTVQSLSDNDFEVCGEAETEFFNRQPVLTKIQMYTLASLLKNNLLAHSNNSQLEFSYLAV